MSGTTVGEILMNATIPAFKFVNDRTSTSDNDSLISETESQQVFDFFTQYHKAHGGLVFSICVFGFAVNIINVVVLTRKHMQENIINLLFCGLSAAQLMLLGNFLVYTIYNIMLDSECAYKTKSYDWILYILFNAVINLITHTIATVHTCLAAVMRFLMIHYPTKKLVTAFRLKMAILLTYLITPILCGSNFFSSDILPHNLTDEKTCLGIEQPTVQIYQLRFRDSFLVPLNLWFFGVFCKLVPCVCLTGLTLALIWDMRKAKLASQKLRNRQSQRAAAANASSVETKNRLTTIMLLIIVFLFILVEFPQCVLIILSATIKDFRSSVYVDTGDFFDMLTVLYSSVNFVLYCSMSADFRKTFKDIFLPKRLLWRLPGANRPVQGEETFV